MSDARLRQQKAPAGVEKLAPYPNRLASIFYPFRIIVFFIFNAVLLLLIFSSLVVITALARGWIGTLWILVGLGIGLTLILPLIFRLYLRRTFARGHRRRSFIPSSLWIVSWNVLLLALLCLGFSDSTGRALRRRGDWFLGQSDGWIPRRYRRLSNAVSHVLERFDLPEEMKNLTPRTIAGRGPSEAPSEQSSSIPPPAPTGAATPRAATSAGWFHPLAGPARITPPNTSCRFGAPRPGSRPPECELGHCGVDLVQPEGSPVFAVTEGTISEVVRDEAHGGISGRYIKIAHQQGAIMSTYVHLAGVRKDLKPGLVVQGGEPIGTLGQTGIRNSGPHLHFSLAVKRRGRFHYIDPELLLEQWQLPSLDEKDWPTRHVDTLSQLVTLQ